MGRSVVSLVDDTFTRGTAHAKYHFYWHYLFTGAIWCTIWTSADCRARVTQTFNPDMCVRVTRLEHGCYGRHEKGNQMLNAACSGEITRQCINLMEHTEMLICPAENLSQCAQV